MTHRYAIFPWIMVIFSIIVFSCEKQPNAIQPSLKYPFKIGTFWQYIVHDTTITCIPTDTTIIIVDTLLLKVIDAPVRETATIATINNAFLIQYNGQSDTFYVFYDTDSIRTDPIPLLSIPELVFPVSLKSGMSWLNHFCDTFRVGSPEKIKLPNGNTLQDVLPVKRIFLCEVEASLNETFYIHPATGLVALKSVYSNFHYCMGYERKYSLQLLNYRIVK